MSYTKLEIQYESPSGDARHVTVKVPKKVQEFGDRYGYESLSISNGKWSLTIRYNSTTLMQREILNYLETEGIKSIVSYEWVGDDGSRFNPNAVEKPKPVVKTQEEKTATYTEKKITVSISDVTYQNLSQKLEQLAREWDEKIDNTEGEEKNWRCKKEKEAALAQVVKFVAAPSEKNDLFDFLVMAQTAFLSHTTNFYLAAAYYAKYQEALFKTKTLFANEDIFSAIFSNEQQVQTQYKKIHWRQPRVGLMPSSKVNLIAFSALAVCVILLFILMPPH